MRLGEDVKVHISSEFGLLVTVMSEFDNPHAPNMHANLASQKASVVAMCGRIHILHSVL